MAAYLCILFTVLSTTYGQIVIKWRINKVGSLPDSLPAKLSFLTAQLFDPWILSGIASALIAVLAWMAAMTRLDLSHAYPFTSLSFVLVLIMSHLLFAEPITLAKTVGLALIIAGIAVGSQG